MAGPRRVIDGTVISMLVLLAVLAFLAHAKGGGELVAQGASGGVKLLARYAIILVLAFVAAGFAEVLVPHDWIRDTLGTDSGVRGIAIAAGAGMITPSGPFVSMPIAAVMIRAGAGPGPIVAFITAWSLLAVHRFVAWEVPILGWRVAALRYGVCLLLPLLAGGLARALSRG